MKPGMLDGYWAALHAACVLAVKAAGCLKNCFSLCIAEVYFVEVRGMDLVVLL